MVMPDAQVVAASPWAGRTTPFGRWVLGQAQSGDRHMQEMATLITFDPRRRPELLVASPGGNDPKPDRAGARDVDLAKISAARLGGGTWKATGSAP
jgi:hypothetical protein